MIKFNKNIVAPLVAFILISVNTFAHFGSKGPFGGTVTCTAQGTILGNVSNQVFFGTSEGGVFVNKDAGLTGWTARPVGLKSGKISALAVTGSYVFAATADSGIFRFTGFVGSDRYWEKVNSGLGNLKITSLVSIDTITLFAGTDNGTIYKTINKGATWTVISGLPFGTSKITGLVRAGARIIAIAETKGVFASDDNGANWTSLNDVNTADIVGTKSLSYNATTNELLVVNSNGVFVLTAANTSNSASYTSVITGLGSVTVKYISNNGTNWFLATNGGVYSSVTGSISWSASNTGLTGGALDINIVTPFSSSLLVGTYKKGIYKTAQNSISWVDNNNTFNNVVTYSMTTSGDQVIVAATENGVFVSKNLATSYTRSNFGLTDSLNVSDVEFFGTKLFATTLNQGVFVSADTGKVWIKFNGGLSQLSFDKIFASKLYVYAIDANGQIFQSNGSNNWVSIQSGLPNGVEPKSLAFLNGKVILGAHGQGVFERSEVSGNWNGINTGLPTDHITSVTAFKNKYYAGTHGLGVFVTDATTINWEAATSIFIPHTSMLQLDAEDIEAMGAYGGYIFASYRGGLVASPDQGETWEPGGNQFNLPTYTAVNKIAFVPTRVFVTTENNALYSNGLSELPLHVGVKNYDNVKCNGLHTGNVTAEATGGTAPYTYSWSNGANKSVINNVAAGKYVVTITDNVANTFKDSIEVIEPVKLAVTFTTVPSSNSNGSAIANVNGGISPFAFLWSNDAKTQTISNLVEGIVSVIVTDNNGCTTTGGASIHGVAGLTDLANTKFSILPNPTKGDFVVNLDGNSSVSSIAIFNGVGKLMNEMNVDKTATSVPMNVNYPSGVYFIKVNSDKGITTHKLIVE
jgi:hypothetical protein